MNSKEDTNALFSEAVALMVKGYFDRALKQFEVAGVKGHGRSALMAGILSLSGFGSVSLEETDHAADALFWFRRAAELGEAEGQYKYAEMLSQGFGAEEDKTKARKWAWAAAEQDQPKASALPQHQKHSTRTRLTLGFCGTGCQTGACWRPNIRTVCSILMHPLLKVGQPVRQTKATVLRPIVS